MGFLAGFIAAAVILAFLLRRQMREKITVDVPVSIEIAPGALVSALTLSESRVPALRPGLGKQVIWADPIGRSKTRVSVVYIHGFSASSGELRPLPDLVAEALGANLFYTRLAGHGLDDPDALGQATLGDWADDVAEALAIGRALGDRVVVIATSTGGSLLTWALAQPQLAKAIAVAVFISPNYGVRASGSFLLTLPFASQLLRLFGRRRYGFEPENALQAYNWTHDYPAAALIPMAEAVQLARGTRIEDIDTPALFIHSPQDKIVRAEETAAVAARWGGPHLLLDPGQTGHASQHVIAGDACSPQTTLAIADRITSWVRTLPGLAP